MAKKKAAGRPGGRPTTGAVRLQVLNMKGSSEYRDWLASLSEKSLIPTTAIVRDALAKWAKARGYPAPPPL